MRGGVPGVRPEAEIDRPPVLTDVLFDEFGDDRREVDDTLADSDYLCGDQFTMADIPLGTAVWRWYNMKVERPALVNLEAWHERLKQRPGFQKVVMLPLT